MKTMLLLLTSNRIVNFIGVHVESMFAIIINLGSVIFTSLFYNKIYFVVNLIATALHEAIMFKLSQFSFTLFDVLFLL